MKELIEGERGKSLNLKGMRLKLEIQMVFSGKQEILKRTTIRWSAFNTVTTILGKIYETNFSVSVK